MSVTFDEVIDYKTLKEIIADGARRGGDKKQLVFEDKDGTVHEKTFADVWNDTVNIGSYLWSLGLDGGKKIAILSENSYQWNVSFYVTMIGSNVSVPLDTRLTVPEIAYQLADCACDAIICSESMKEMSEEIMQQPGVVVKHLFVTSDFEDLAEKGKALSDDVKEAFKNAVVEPDQMACIAYTSGTTGKTKGVMLSHRNVACNVVSSCAIVKGGHGLGFLPLNHTYSWISGLFATFIKGEWGFICTNLMHIYKDIKKYKPTNFAAVPLAVEMIYNNIIVTAKRNGTYDKLMSGIEVSKNMLAAGLDMRRQMFSEIHENLGGELEYIYCGGAHLDQKIEEFMFYIGIQIITGYGLTECSPCVTACRKYEYRFGSIGKTLDCCEIMINDPDEEGIGEIYVKGENIMMGYYGDEEATKSVFDGEWFTTGDLGYIDPDGFLYFKGRRKNLIILSNGKNVSPEEIEDKLNDIEYVKECLVYADERNRITAEFFLDKDKYPDCEERLPADVERVNSEIAEFKQILRTVIRDTEFPKTSTLKIRRNYKK